MGLGIYHGTAIQSGPEVPPKLYIDPGSNRKVTFQQLDINIGVNLASNMADVGFVGGFAGMERKKNRQIYPVCFRNLFGISEIK